MSYPARWAGRHLRQGHRAPAGPWTTHGGLLLTHGDPFCPSQVLLAEAPPGSGGAPWSTWSKRGVRPIPIWGPSPSGVPVAHPPGIQTWRRPPLDVTGFHHDTAQLQQKGRQSRFGSKRRSSLSRGILCEGWWLGLSWGGCSCHAIKVCPRTAKVGEHVRSGSWVCMQAS